MKQKQLLATALYLYGMAAQSFANRFSDTLQNGKPEHTIAPKQRPVAKQVELACKGLQEYVIQGETIIAHNHDEAWKRYNHRHKNK